MVTGVAVASGTEPGGTEPGGTEPEGTADPASRSTYAPDPLGQDDRIDALPPEAQGIGIDEQIGQTLPLDVPFTNSNGDKVTLGQYFDGGLPAIVTFNYSNCPMLCSLQLNGLYEAMRGLMFDVGVQYRVITITLDPKETPERARETKDKYLLGFPDDSRKRAEEGWIFLTGDPDAIQAATSAAGLSYKYLEKTKEYSHPASLVLVSPRGTISSYYHGINYEPKTLEKSIFLAGAGEEGVSIGFLLACFQLGNHGDYAKMSENIMRYGTIGFLILILAAFGTWQVARSRRARQE